MKEKKTVKALIIDCWRKISHCAMTFDDVIQLKCQKLNNFTFGVFYKRSQKINHFTMSTQNSSATDKDERKLSQLLLFHPRILLNYFRLFVKIA